MAERERRLARFDRSGNCRSIFPSVETILCRLHSAELNYPQDGAPWLRRMAWSRRTVFVYLKRLKLAGISKSSGLSSYHGTKRRALDPEKLLLAPLESCTPTRRESCTRSKSLDSKKLQRSRKNQNHPADDTPCGPLECETLVFNPNPVKPPVEETAKPEPYTAGLARFRTVARKNILARATESPEAVDAILNTVLERAADAGTVIHSSAYLERGFDSQVADDAAHLEPYGADLVASGREMRRKIAFVHAAVERGAREGRPAREVLAELLPP